MLKKENYKIAFDVWGLVLFLIIMIPNFVWFAIPSTNDVLREASITTLVDMIASVFQVIMVVSLCVLTNKDSKHYIDKTLFIGVTISIMLYFIGWGLYYAGVVNIVIILDLSIAPCLAFILFSISRKNVVALLSAMIFTICHILYAVINFIM